MLVRPAPAGRSRWCGTIALCLTIVAVFQLRPAAATISEDVLVPGGTAALAQSLGIDPVPDRGRFLYEITRILYNTPEGRRASADAYLAAACASRWPAARAASPRSTPVRGTRCRCR
jgi:hypothetical protein